VPSRDAKSRLPSNESAFADTRDANEGSDGPDFSASRNADDDSQRRKDIEEVVITPGPEPIGEEARPTASTTPEDMARLRPDLLTGELKAPNLDEP